MIGIFYISVYCEATFVHSCLWYQIAVFTDADLGFYNRKKKMEDVPDIASFSSKLKNTLILYHNIEDEKWRVAKKTVSLFNYLSFIFV